MTAAAGDELSRHPEARAGSSKPTPSKSSEPDAPPPAPVAEKRALAPSPRDLPGDTALAPADRKPLKNGYSSTSYSRVATQHIRELNAQARRRYIVRVALGFVVVAILAGTFWLANLEPPPRTRQPALAASTMPPPPPEIQVPGDATTPLPAGASEGSSPQTAGQLVEGQPPGLTDSTQPGSGREADPPREENRSTLRGIGPNENSTEAGSAPPLPAASPQGGLVTSVAIPPTPASPAEQEAVRMAEAYGRRLLKASTPGEFDAILVEAAGAKSDSPYYWFWLTETTEGFLRGRTGVPEEARLSRLAALHEKALIHGSSDPAVVERVADFLTKAGRTDAGIQIYRLLVSLTPDDPEPGRKLAAALLAAGKIDEGAALLESLVARFPLDLPILQTSVNHLLREKQSDKAVALVDSFLRRDPASGPAAALKTNLLARDLGKPDEAIKFLEAHIDKNPGDATLRLQLAEILLADTRWDDAYAAFARCESMAASREEQVAMLNGSFYRAFARAAFGAGKLDEAEALYRKALALLPKTAPDRSDSLNNLAHLLLIQRKDLDAALVFAREAVQGAPQSPDCLDTLGLAQIVAGDFPKAIATLEKANKMFGDSPPADHFLHLGDAYAGLGLIPNAVGAWEKGLAIDPGQQELKSRIAEAARSR